jgi:hypothetical protein
MSRFVAAAFAFALSMAPIGSAHAQGVFDMGALTSSIATNAGAAGATQGVSISIDTLKYTPSAELSKENLAKFYKGLNDTSPGLGTQFEQGFAGQDVFGLLDSELTKYGVNPNNLGDAMAIYWLGSWMAINARTDDPTTAQVVGTRKLVEGALGNAPSITKLSDADKQSTAQALLLQFMLNEIMLEGVKGDPAALKKVRGDLATGVKAISGFDPSLFELTPNGLARKK